MKRLLALLLSACLIAGIYLPTGRTKAASVLVKSDTAQADMMSYYLNNTSTSVYWATDFAEKTDYENALGTYPNTNHMLNWKDGSIYSADTTVSTLFYGVKEATSLQNYTVEADVTTNKYMAVVAYGSPYGKTTGNKWNVEGYEFGVVNGAFRLGYRSNATGFKQLGTTTNVATLYSGYNVGDTITLSLKAITQTDGIVILNCYAIYNGMVKRVLTYTDTTYKKASGAPGLTTNTSNTADNLIVTKETVLDNVPTYSLNGKGTTVYYEEVLKTAQHYADALGSYASNIFTMHLEDGLLTNNGSNANHTMKNAMFYGIQNAESMQNYTISADVAMESDSKYAVVVAYGQGNLTNTADSTTSGYEFGIVNSSSANTQSFRLYARGLSESINISKNITDYFSEYKLGDSVTVSIEAATEENKITLNCYAAYKGTTKLIITKEIENASRKNGVPGLKTTDIDGSMSNVTVKSIVANANLLYVDDFGYKNAYADAVENTANRNLQWTQNKLIQPDGSTRFALFGGIAQADELTDYTVAADFIFPKAESYYGLIGYGKQAEGNLLSTGYEFAVVSGNFRLYRRDAAGTSKVLEGGNADYAVSKFFRDYVMGTDSVTLSLAAETNQDESVTLTCKAVHKNVEETIFTHTDSTTSKITSGTAGVRGTLKDTVIDNLRITKMESAPIEPDEPYEEDGSLPFVETFDELLKYKNRWNNGNTVTITDEQAVLDETVSSLYLTGISEALGWSSYTYEADVTLTSSVVNASQNARVAAIVAATTGSTDGYEFGLVYYPNKTDGSKFEARLYERATGKSKYASCDFALDTSVKMRMEVSGNTIKCYADGKSILEYKVSGVSELTGAIGIRANGNKAIYDNLTVTEYIPYSEDATLPFVENFDVVNSIVNRWDNGGKGTLENEQVVLDEKATSMYLTGLDGVYDWKDYIYEADVTVTETAISENKGKVVAIVVAANEQNQGYEFGLMYNPTVSPDYQVRLYDRVTGKTLDSKEYYFDYNVAMRMKMIVSDNLIQCYIDDELLLQVPVADVKELTGTVGFAVNGISAKYDNLSVKAFEGTINTDVPAPLPNQEGIYFFDDFNEEVNLSNNKWSKNVLDLSHDRALVKGDKGLLYLTADEGFKRLENYAVSAKVTVSLENDVEEKNCVGAIVARSLGETTGYEFGMLYSAGDSYVRLYDRTAGKELGRSKDIKLELGQEYLLTMVCEENNIVCYLDGEPVISVLDNTNKSGTAGIRSIGEVYCDDYMLTIPEYISKLGWNSPNGSSSPATGDGNWNLIPILGCTFVLSFLTIVMAFTLRNKKERE